MKTNICATALTATVLLSACADSEYVPVVDGPRAAHFNPDLTACRHVARQARIDQTDIAAGAVVGGLLAGATASDGARLEDAVGGAIIGGLIGAAESASETGARRDAVVLGCMKGRGHRVVG